MWLSWESIERGDNNYCQFIDLSILFWVIEIIGCLSSETKQSEMSCFWSSNPDWLSLWQISQLPIKSNGFLILEYILQYLLGYILEYILGYILEYILEYILGYILEYIFGYILKYIFGYILEYILRYILEYLFGYILEYILRYIFDAWERLAIAFYDMHYLPLQVHPNWDRPCKQIEWFWF